MKHYYLYFLLYFLSSGIIAQGPAIPCGTGADGAYSPISNVNIPSGTYHFTSVNIPAGVIVNVIGSGGLIIYCSGSVVVNGSIRANGGDGTDGITYVTFGTGGIANGGGANGGNGSFASGSGPIDGQNGLGEGPGFMGSAWSGGGGAGHANNGSSASVANGLGGMAYGDSELTVAYGGSGGGGGSGGYDCGAGGGGAGGGIIFIYSCGGITIGASGSIECKGGNGGSDGTGNCGGGGGGSGGTIYINTNTLINGGVISVDGGMGGSSTVSGEPYFGEGGAGSEGRILIEIQDNCISTNWENQQIGASSGAAQYSECVTEIPDTFYIQSFGNGLPNADNRHFVYQSACGDMSITARVLSIDGGGWGGISLQEQLTSGSKKAALKTQLSALIFREIRSVTGGNQNLMTLNRPKHKWLRLTRTGNVFTGYSSINGVNWVQAFSTTITMSECIYLGLFAESINNSTQTSVTFDQVQVTTTTTITLPGSFNNHVETDTRLFKTEVFPNPVSGLLNVKLDQDIAMECTIQVLDLLGNVQYHTVTGATKHIENQINFSDMPAGVYLLRIMTPDNKISNTKIVKQ
jgi:hypothetical protein